jgi:hypothetical protein
VAGFLRRRQEPLRVPTAAGQLPPHTDRLPGYIVATGHMPGCKQLASVACRSLLFGSNTFDIVDSKQQL